MAKIRTSQEVRDDIAAIEAEIKQLQDKANTPDGLTPEEADRLAQLVAQLEQLQTEQQAASANERYISLKAKQEEVQRSLPQYKPAATPKNDEAKHVRGLGYWLSPDRTPEAVEKIRSAGFDPNAKTIKVPLNVRNMNFKKRTVLSTGGAGSGAEWMFKTYSDQVFEYLTYENPILGFLNTESLSNGSERYYFDVDDTSLVATDVTASSGTEIAKTIPETNITSAQREIKVKTITSGYQKVTMEMLQDSPFSLEEKIAKASTKAMARKMDKDVITATGNGVTNVQGLRSICTALAGVDAWSIDALESLVDAVPDYYRSGCIFVSNGPTKSDVRRALKDTTGRTLFERADVGDLRFESLFDYTWVVSSWMPDDEVLFINPAHYTLGVVNNQIFQRFDEKFFDQVAWAGLLRFGGARTGDAQAFKKLALDAGS